VEPGREVFTDTTKSTITEMRESYDVTKIEGSLATFPDEMVPGMRVSHVALAEKSKELTFRILRAIALSLNVDQEYFVDNQKLVFNPGSITDLRSIYYPPLQGGVEPGILRCGEHTDYGLITLLYQDSMGGLEVKGPTGEWIKASPVPGTILVNAGDMLEIFTSGRLHAAMHRVVVPEDEIKRKAVRQSIVFFDHPDNQAPVHPLPGFENVNNDEKYLPTTAEKHLQKRFAASYRY